MNGQEVRSKSVFGIKVLTVLFAIGFLGFLAFSSGVPAFPIVGIIAAGIIGTIVFYISEGFNSLIEKTKK